MSYGSQLFVADDQAAKAWFDHVMACDDAAQELLVKSFQGNCFLPGVTQVEIGVLHAALTGKPYDLAQGGETLVAENPEGAWLIKISPDIVAELAQSKIVKDDVQCWRNSLKDLFGLSNPSLKIQTANSIIELCRKTSPSDTSLFLFFAG